MKKEIRNVDEKRGIVQVTIADERWYLRDSKDEITGLPIIQHVPSVTWISGSYPKGIPFYKWLAEKGWDESEAIKQAAGNKGSKIHLAIGDILSGKEVRIDSKYINKGTGQEEELTLEECDAILSFKSWFDSVKPKTITWEYTVFSNKYGYAGTVDYICEIEGEVWIVDFKTGQYIWPEYELQISAYKQTIANAENHIQNLDVSGIKLAVLQLGYRRNKNMYKFTEIDDKFKLFLAARQIWENEHGEEKPSKKDYPIILSPALVTEDIVFESSKDEKKEEVKETVKNLRKKLNENKQRTIA
ncbi:MAG: hypothetical protein AAB706_01445 [Patescibacteria group bacterium]